MVRVSAGNGERQWGRVQDLAVAEPATITSDGRDRMVLLSAAEYLCLKRRDRQVMTLDDFKNEDLEALEEVRAPVESLAFNHEVSE